MYSLNVVGQKLTMLKQPQVSNGEIHFFPQFYKVVILTSFERTLSTCSGGLGRCSFHIPKSGSRCESGCNSIYFPKEIC